VDLELKLSVFRPEEGPPPLRPAEEKRYVNAEHAKLVGHALANERLLCLTRMRLRLLHDQRALDALRKRLARINADDDDDTESAAQRLRERCRVVRAKIEREKDRIRQENWVCANEYFAAVAIQSAWRGVLFRRNRRPESN
jgi:hypothetical protein